MTETFTHPDLGTLDYEYNTDRGGVRNVADRTVRYVFDLANGLSVSLVHSHANSDYNWPGSMGYLENKWEVMTSVRCALADKFGFHGLLTAGTRFDDLLPVKDGPMAFAVVTSGEFRALLASLSQLDPPTEAELMKMYKHTFSLLFGPSNPSPVTTTTPEGVAR